MDPRETMRRWVTSVRRWLGLTEVRTLLPIFLIAMAGPFGEMLDVALFLDMEVEILASDLGLEAVSSILVYGSQILIAILAAIALASLPVAFPDEGPKPIRVLASCRTRRPVKVPIR